MFLFSNAGKRLSSAFRLVSLLPPFAESPSSQPSNSFPLTDHVTWDYGHTPLDVFVAERKTLVVAEEIRRGEEKQFIHDECALSQQIFYYYSFLILRSR